MGKPQDWRFRARLVAALVDGSIMVLFCFYAFDRHGTCLYYEEWHRKHFAPQTKYDVRLSPLPFHRVFRDRTGGGRQPNQSWACYSHDAAQLLAAGGCGRWRQPALPAVQPVLTPRPEGRNRSSQSE